jgi:hypothetical protein
MALHFYTDDPGKLLAEIKNNIDQDHIITWKYDDDGDFIHDKDQWKYKMWLRPKITTTALNFYTIKNSNFNVSVAAYAIYHGRFIEMVLDHFDHLFESVSASALAEAGDMVR